jgi:hypothetical protein
MKYLPRKELEADKNSLAYLKALRPVKAFFPFLYLLQAYEILPPQFISSRFRRSHIFAVIAA